MLQPPCDQFLTTYLNHHYHSWRRFEICLVTSNHSPLISSIQQTSDLNNPNCIITNHHLVPFNPAPFHLNSIEHNSKTTLQTSQSHNLLHSFITPISSLSDILVPQEFHHHWFIHHRVHHLIHSRSQLWLARGGLVHISIPVWIQFHTWLIYIVSFMFDGSLGLLCEWAQRFFLLAIIPINCCTPWMKSEIESGPSNGPTLQITIHHHHSSNEPLTQSPIIYLFFLPFFLHFLSVHEFQFLFMTCDFC